MERPGKVDAKGTAKFDASDLTDTKMSGPRLTGSPLAYVPANANVIVIELSIFAGYAGLIAANGGLAPNPDSIFAKKYGFQLKISLSEEESWNAAPIEAERWRPRRRRRMCWRFMGGSFR